MATSDGRDDDGEEVPRLPRGRGLRLSGPELVRILLLASLLVLLVVTQRPCSNAVSRFVTSFGDQPGSAGTAGSGAAGSGYEHLRPGMTDDEIKAAIQRARARAAGSGSSNSNSGSAAQP